MITTNKSHKLAGGIEKLEPFIIVIPSLNPDSSLIKLLGTIRQSLTAAPILIVNDGSSDSHEAIFEEAIAYDCVVKKHEMNLGKGAALKTALQHVLTDYPTIEYIVTIDSDSQHSMTDLLACVETAQQNPTSLVFGTGASHLRVIPRRFLASLLQIKGDRFDYETNMLIALEENSMPIVTHPINALYIDKSGSSSSKPIDVFLKYLLSSGMSFLLDLLVFAVTIRLITEGSLASISIASFSARAVSSMFNYYLNREHVFKSQSQSSVVKYFSLVVFQIALSSFFVYLSSQLFYQADTVLFKVIVDGLLFVFSYFVQKYMVFKP